MEIYKICVDDRNYASWQMYDTISFQSIVKDIDINPCEQKLFNNDFFTIDKENKKINIIHSSIRSDMLIPGVLVIANNKTYGRKKSLDTKNKVNNKSNNNKLLYKCIPDDVRIPSFLIPYELKNIGFSKVFVNLYVTFHFTHWDEKSPHGTLASVIGPVNVLDNFYEYQLYCKSLNASIQNLHKATSNVINNQPHNTFIENIKNKYDCIEDRTSQKKWKVFTIDPTSSTDLDDGFSIQTTEDAYHVSIYISNVTIWMDVLNLWDSFSRRISTIYLPDRKRPMLPTILSDCLCSLLENCTRIAFVMDLFIHKQTGEVLEMKFSNCMINVYKNYRYEEEELLKDTNYQSLMSVAKMLSLKYKYIPHLRNSHDLVCYLMIFMNYHCAKDMLSFKNGIFRSTIIHSNMTVSKDIPDEIANTIKIWNSSCGQYINGADINDTNVRHELLDMDAYIHITSPIRRLVDLLNIIQFQKNRNLIQLSENVDVFYKKWIDDIDYINTTMRAIRKVQIDCSFLDLCHNNPDTLIKEYDGYLFDKLTRSDGLTQFMVYLPEIKMMSRITIRENINNFDRQKFKLYLFHNENKFKKKIRLQLLS